jgi:hypothetical protein
VDAGQGVSALARGKLYALSALRLALCRRALSAAAPGCPVLMPFTCYGAARRRGCAALSDLHRRGPISVFLFVLLAAEEGHRSSTHMPEGPCPKWKTAESSTADKTSVRMRSPTVPCIAFHRRADHALR